MTLCVLVATRLGANLILPRNYESTHLTNELGTELFVGVLLLNMPVRYPWVYTTYVIGWFVPAREI